MPRERTVLWVDDDPSQLALVSIIAQTRGWRVFTADRPETAVSIYETQKPAAIVLDVILKTYSTDRRSGIDICNSIREKDEDTIIVFSTGMDSDFLKLETKMARADWTFVKPHADPNDILAKIEDIQAKKETLKSRVMKAPQSDRSQWGIFHFTGRELVFIATFLFALAVNIWFMARVELAITELQNKTEKVDAFRIADDGKIMRIQGTLDAITKGVK